MVHSLEICTGYEYQGKILHDFPASLKVLEDCKPVYETLPGWPEDISGARTVNDLPPHAIDYIKRIEELTETPVHIISVGPDREETIIIRNPFRDL